MHCRLGQPWRHHPWQAHAFRGARREVLTSSPRPLHELHMNHPLVSYPKDSTTPTSHLPFSPAVVVGDLILVSGRASVDATGKIVGDTFEGEFRRSVENLRKVLETAGSDLAHVVQTR